MEKDINNSIKEDYCSFEIAKLLKEKGFNNSSDYNYYYDHRNTSKLKPSGVDCISNESQLLTICPTHSLAIKWIRENFDIDIHIEWSFKKDRVKYYAYHIDGRESTKGYSLPEEATEAALLYTLKNLIK